MKTINPKIHKFSLIKVKQGKHKEKNTKAVHIQMDEI